MLSRDLDNLTRIDFNNGKTPEMVFTEFCRVAEQLIEQKFLNASFKDSINRMPLIFFDAEKAQRVLDFEKGDTHMEILLPFHNCTIVDPGGIVRLTKAEIIKRDGSLGELGSADLSDSIFKSPVGIFPALDEHFKTMGDPNPVECILYASFIVSFTHKLPEPNDGAGTFVMGKLILAHSDFLKRRWMDTFNCRCFMEFSGKFEEMHGGSLEIGIGDAATAVGTALEEMHYMSQPNQYIVCITPTKVREISQAKKIIRAHERNRIVPLTPEQLRKVYVPKGGHHASPLPHDVRGHPRTFKHERYTKVRGQTIWVEEYKVKGGERWEFGNKIYEVMEKD